jgi:hypothetical protein
MQIGSHAIPVLLDRIAETDETNIIAKCVRVCYRIEGRELTQVRLQELREIATDPKKKDRIQTAIGILTGLDPFEIGVGGAPDLLYRVAESLPPTLPESIIENCVAMQGREMTQFRLQRLLEKETDATRKARIQSALDFLEMSQPAK